MPYRQSLWRYQVFVENVDTGQYIDLGIADEFTGGSKTAESEDFSRGDGTTQPLGGDAKREPGTATYLYTEAVHAVFRIIDRGVGAAKVRVVATPTDDNRMPWANPYTMVGMLTTAPLPEGGGGKNAAATIALNMSLQTELAA